MRPNGSAKVLERRRYRAIELLERGESITEISRRLGCSHSSVILWRDKFHRDGSKGLTAKPTPGRPPKLEPKKLLLLVGLLLRGALAWGYSTQLWTTQRIADVIQREFGIRYHRAHVSRILMDMNWSCQKPERRAIERDEAAIEHWKRYRWPAIKKKRNT